MGHNLAVGLIVNMLESWPARLDALGIEHGEILDRSYGAGLAFRDPDNIQLEFFLPMDS
jgi:glyoxylase I family protein